MASAPQCMIRTLPVGDENLKTIIISIACARLRFPLLQLIHFPAGRILWCRCKPVHRNRDRPAMSFTPEGCYKPPPLEPVLGRLHSSPTPKVRSFEESLPVTAS